MEYAKNAQAVLKRLRTQNMWSVRGSGHVEAFQLAADAMDKWMESTHTDPDLAAFMLEYVKE